jgi:hypothetical protein
MLSCPKAGLGGPSEHRRRLLMGRIIRDQAPGALSYRPSFWRRCSCGTTSAVKSAAARAHRFPASSLPKRGCSQAGPTRARLRLGSSVRGRRCLSLGGTASGLARAVSSSAGGDWNTVWLRNPRSRRQRLWWRFRARVCPPRQLNLNLAQRLLWRLNRLFLGGREQRRAKRAAR